MKYAALSFFGGLLLGLTLREARKRARTYGKSGKKAAVILCGVGYLDGSEVTEAVSILVSLSEMGVKAQVFAPDANQTDVVDHQTGKALGYVPRHMIQESARISRGNVRPLSELDANEFDALLCPGGFGVAKSLSNWAKGDVNACVVLADVKRVLLQFREQAKPIGLCCIAPTLACKCFQTVTVTVGKPEPADAWPYGGTVSQLKSISGVTHEEHAVHEVCVDYKNKLVTSPAYMSGTAGPHEVFFGVRKMVQTVVGLMR